MTSLLSDQQSLQDEIADLERRLLDAKVQLNQHHDAPRRSSPDNGAGPLSQNTSTPRLTDDTSALHALLLLSDSALPLGSFAFSSGLESYLAHHKLSPPSASQLPLFNTFLRLSLSTLASTALPYVLAGYRNPDEIETLDNDFDASTPCTVARRASIAQGRALLAVWDRSFKTQYSSSHITTRQCSPSSALGLDHSNPRCPAARSCILVSVLARTNRHQRCRACKRHGPLPSSSGIGQCRVARQDTRPGR
jgi:urease accessory protein